MNSIRALSCVALCLALGCDAPNRASPFAFKRFYVDTEYGGNGKPGWVRAADADGDGHPDLIAGGGFALFVYRNDGQARGWQRFGNLDASERMGANGAILYDVDGDGDLDVISARYYGPLAWWENPGAERWEGSRWVSHDIGKEDWFLHDIIMVDLDGDGRREIVTNRIDRGIDARVRLRWYRSHPLPGGRWEGGIIEPGRDDGSNNHAGLDAGDLDGDGRIDLAYSNGWYRNPGRLDRPWSWHPVTDTYGISNILIREMNGDGRPDLVMSAGHHGRGLYWFAAPPDPRRDVWGANVIDEGIQHPECLDVADLDSDGDWDVITCSLDFERWNREVHDLYVLENRGQSRRWLRWTIAAHVYPNHLLQTVDINGDGMIDIISEATGFGVVSYYEQQPRQP